MSNELQVFTQQEVLGKQFDIYGDSENPLFLAKDVAVLINYSRTGKGSYDVSRMLSKVDEDEKVTNNVRTLGGTQESWFLTEDGLYEVLMQSRKPIAKQFKKKVKEILKAIRKTGHYETPEYKLMLTMQNKVELLTQQNTEMETKVNHLTDVITSNIFFKPIVNKRHAFDTLKIRYMLATGASRDNIRAFYDNIGDWFGIRVPYSDSINITVKDWIIAKVPMDELELFVCGIEKGHIVKSERGHWVDLNGFGGNNVEWNKVLNEFDHSCAYCGRSDKPLIPEHIVCQSYMSEAHPEQVDLIGNIVCSCGTCNKSKGKHEVTEWYTEQPYFKQSRLEKIYRHQSKYRVNEWC